MFDQNWRDVADLEEENPQAAYQPGAHVDCGPLGIGVIQEVQERGRTKQLIVKFGNGNIKHLNLNVTMMKIIDNPED
jgi:hypothetical protein